MYDSRSDADLPRRAWNHFGPDTEEAHARFDREGVKANRETGWGDCIEWSTPRSRQLATKRMERRMVAEGLLDYEDALLEDVVEAHDCEAAALEFTARLLGENHPLVVAGYQHARSA